MKGPGREAGRVPSNALPPMRAADLVRRRSTFRPQVIVKAVASLPPAALPDHQALTQVGQWGNMRECLLIRVGEFADGDDLTHTPRVRVRSGRTPGAARRRRTDRPPTLDPMDDTADTPIITSTPTTATGSHDGPTTGTPTDHPTTRPTPVTGVAGADTRTARTTTTDPAAGTDPTTGETGTEGTAGEAAPGATPSEATTPGAADRLTAPLRRPEKGRMLGGVCAGMATAWRVDPLPLRIAFVATALLLFPVGLLLYLACWILMPQEDTTEPVKPAH